MKDWQKTLVSANTPVREIIQNLNTTAMQIAVVVDDNKRLQGTITDGDIRRALLRGISLSDLASQIMNKDPKVAGHTDKQEANVRKMTKYKLRHLPIIDSERHVVGISAYDELLQPAKKENRVVLMAGGLGSRMSPLTDDCPKPMLTVGNKPILEIILDNCIRSGFQNFHISVNYKAEMIQDYFGDGSKWNTKINYIRESQQLGTAGPLGLFNEMPDSPIIVMNGDVLTKLNLQQMLDFHEEHKAPMTMAVREYDFQVPYGVVRMDKLLVAGIDEKPVHKFFVNAGIYILEPKILELIPKNEFFDMPDLVAKLIELNQRPAAFPISEYWLDVGRKADFERANGDFSEAT
jgi:dTDP-glucose pyrophosphorylase